MTTAMLFAIKELLTSAKIILLFGLVGNTPLRVAVLMRYIRDLAIEEGIAKKLSDDAIASELKISARTVNRVRVRLLKKP